MQGRVFVQSPGDPGKFLQPAIGNLSETRISDAGLQKLKGLKNLKQVRVVGTNVTDAGAQHFDESRP